MRQLCPPFLSVNSSESQAEEVYVLSPESSLSLYLGSVK